MIVVLCIRDPDASNEFTVEGGDATIIDVDLGYADLDDPTECRAWAINVLWQVKGLPTDSGIRQRVEQLVTSKCEDADVEYPTEQEIRNG